MLDGRLGPEIAQFKHVRYSPSNADNHRAQWGGNRNPLELLDPSQVYEVERVEVHSWHTKVWLVGIGGPFNSTHFQAVEPAQHPNNLRLVEPAPDIQVHPTIVTAIGTMHTWLADHPDTAEWLAQLPIERQLQLTDLAIRSYLAGRAAVPTVQQQHQGGTP